MNEEEAIIEFLEELSARGFEPLLVRCSGTIRFDVTGGRSVEHLAVNIDRGRIEVSREELAADSVVRGGPGCAQRSDVRTEERGRCHLAG